MKTSWKIESWKCHENIMGNRKLIHIVGSWYWNQQQLIKPRLDPKLLSMKLLISSLLIANNTWKESWWTVSCVFSHGRKESWFTLWSPPAQQPSSHRTNNNCWYVCWLSSHFLLTPFLHCSTAPLIIWSISSLHCWFTLSSPPVQPSSHGTSWMMTPCFHCSTQIGL